MNELEKQVWAVILHIKVFLWLRFWGHWGSLKAPRRSEVNSLKSCTPAIPGTK